jgi:hypothetical protein
VYRRRQRWVCAARRYSGRCCGAWQGSGLTPFPYLSPALGIALKLAYGVVVCEFLAISFIRYRFTGGKLAR